MGYTLESFAAAAHDILAADPGPAGRERLRIHVRPFAHDRDPARLQGIEGQRGHVSSCHQHHRAAVLEDARVRLRDHLKAFHEGERYVTLGVRRRSTRATKRRGHRDTESQRILLICPLCVSVTLWPVS